MLLHFVEKEVELDIVRRVGRVLNHFELVINFQILVVIIIIGSFIELCLSLLGHLRLSV